MGPQPGPPFSPWGHFPSLYSMCEVDQMPRYALGIHRLVWFSGSAISKGGRPTPGPCLFQRMAWNWAPVSRSKKLKTPQSLNYKITRTSSASSELHGQCRTLISRLLKWLQWSIKAREFLAGYFSWKWCLDAVEEALLLLIAARRLVKAVFAQSTYVCNKPV